MMTNRFNSFLAAAFALVSAGACDWLAEPEPAVPPPLGRLGGGAG